MTDHRDNEPHGPTHGDDRPASIVVPGIHDGEPTDEEVATELQQVRDLGSASRSCVAIIVVLVALALVMCVFLFWAVVIH